MIYNSRFLITVIKIALCPRYQMNIWFRFGCNNFIQIFNYLKVIHVF